ncbi:glycosyltransferase [Brachybacterium hainanense]|uniref:Glycosyltransferase n=1 Tax=Brachybacterium hainanense TaxID=1541174 RepID=A0ABV6RF91_9MICO
MRALFLTADLGGNVPPTLSVAEELTRRGVDVEVTGLDEGRTALPQTAFEPALAAGPGAGGRGLAKAGSMLRLMAGRGTRGAAERLVPDRQADVVVVDCMLPAVLAGALRAEAPVAVLFHTLGEYWIRAFDGGAGGTLFGASGLRPRRLWERAQARLLLTDRELDPSSDDPTLHRYSWTGTAEQGAAPAPREDSARPRVLVALSSTDWPGMLPVYRRIVAALSDLPVDAVVTTGGVDLGGELAGTANVEVLGWADHRELLPRTDLMIGHGGHSSTMKALAHGVPLLVLPINPTSDQRLIGQVTQEQGLGRWLPKRAKTDQIRDAVHAILADAGLRERAARTGERMRALRLGAAVAADRIMETLGKD